MTDNDTKWNMKYEQLVEFKRKKGHCMVPHRYEQNKSLGIWVHHQRASHANNKLRLDRKDILDKIGFAWKANETDNDKLWQQQYKKIVEFKRKNGHCIVPTKYEQDKALGRWVNEQRKNHTKNKLRLDRKDLLDEIGFAWKDDADDGTFKPDDKLWRQQYEKLLEYKRNKGHCMVPARYEQDPSLGMWVARQRNFHNNNKMRPDRKELLDELNFVWKADTVATRCSATKNSDSVAFTSSMGLPNEALKETDHSQGHVKDRYECPSLNRKRPSTSLVESGGMDARTNQRGKATASSSPVEEDGGGRDEEDSKPSLVTSSAARIGSRSDQEVVQEQATPLGEIPYGWIRIKLEPDC